MTRWSCRRRLTGGSSPEPRRVRLGDASPGGRLRLDALARYLQDVSNDDTRDAGLDDDGWVVRRTALRGRAHPGDGRGAGAADVLQRDRWAVGRAAGPRPRRPGRRSRGGEPVGARRPGHGPAGAARAAGSSSSTARRRAGARCGLGCPTRTRRSVAAARRWPLRATDFDVMGHMNNAAYWAAVEEELRRRRELRAPLGAEVEFRAAIEPDDEVDIVTAGRRGRPAPVARPPGGARSARRPTCGGSS